MLLTFRNHMIKTKLKFSSNNAIFRQQKNLSLLLLHTFNLHQNKTRCYVELPTDEFLKENPIKLSDEQKTTSQSPEENLSQWITENKGDLYGVRIGKSDISGHGLFSKIDMVKGDFIMNLPMHLTMMVYPKDSEEQLQISDDELPDTQIKLAIKLLKEKYKGRNSEFWPYIESLPKNIINPNKVMQYINNDNINIESLNSIKKYYNETVNEIISILKKNGINDVQVEDVQWSLAVVQSRAFGNGMGQELCIPYVDMMNHGDMYTNDMFPDHPRANVTYGWRKIESNDENSPRLWQMYLKAKETIQKDEELFVSYGDHSNEYFLLYYGFIPMNNPRDDVKLFNNLDDALDWYFKYYSKLRITKEQKERLKEEIKVKGKMAEVVKLNLCADGTTSPIMLEFFLFLFKGDENLALTAIAKACWQRLEESSSLLSDLNILAKSYIEDDSINETSLFEFQLRDYKDEISEYCNEINVKLNDFKKEEIKLKRHSIEWWIMVHDVLKKMIMWDFILDVRPTRVELDLSNYY